MIDRALHQADGEDLETLLRHDLARGDAVAQAAGPVLRQLVAVDGNLAVTDEIVARIRGMLQGIAGALLDALPEPAASDSGSLTRALTDSPALLSHLHAMALEWQLAEQLQVRLALDPVLPPLLEELVTQDGARSGDLAARFLTAQARWCHLQRDMRLSLCELPNDLFHAALLIWRAHIADRPDMAERAASAEAELRECYHHAERRLDLAGQLVSKLDGGARAALALGRAGGALFLTALALCSGQDRDAVIVSTGEAQLSRLALTLRGAGLETEEVERQLLTLHPELPLSPGHDALNPALAAALLNSGRGRT